MATFDYKIIPPQMVTWGRPPVLVGLGRESVLGKWSTVTISDGYVRSEFVGVLLDDFPITLGLEDPIERAAIDEQGVLRLYRPGEDTPALVMELYLF